jgi:hypothetical protein
MTDDDVLETWEMNKDIKRRDEIIFGEYKPDDYKFGGVKRFSNLSLNSLTLLVEEGFLHPEDYQNCSPYAEDFVNFLKQHPDFTAHGYSVDISREDYRVTIEGIELSGTTSRETEREFVKFARCADEFEVSDNGLYCWWD